MITHITLEFLEPIYPETLSQSTGIKNSVCYFHGLVNPVDRDWSQQGEFLDKWLSRVIIYVLVHVNVTLYFYNKQKNIFIMMFSFGLGRVTWLLGSSRF